MNDTIAYVRALYTRNGAEHFEKVSLSMYRGDLHDTSAVLAHCQKVIEIVRPGAVVTKIGAPWTVENR